MEAPVEEVEVASTPEASGVLRSCQLQYQSQVVGWVYNLHQHILIIHYSITLKHGGAQAKGGLG